MNLDQMRNEYRYNAKFRDYVDKYCENNECTTEEALKHRTIQLAMKMYTEV